jgi:hypothetical protein
MKARSISILCRKWKCLYGARTGVVLVGDAASCVSLIAGQGASLAMAGAFLLAEELNLAAGNIGLAVARYEQKMRPAIERKQAAGRAMVKWFVPASHLRLAIRNTVIDDSRFDTAVVKTVLRHRQYLRQMIVRELWTSTLDSGVSKRESIIDLIHGRSAPCLENTTFRHKSGMPAIRSCVSTEPSTSASNRTGTARKLSTGAVHQAGWNRRERTASDWLR